MKVNIIGKGISLTPAIKDYVKKKIKHVEKLIDPNDDSALATIEIGKTTKHHNAGPWFVAEIALHIAGKDLVAKQEHEDLYAAIDLLKDSISSEVTAHRTRKIARERRGARTIKNIIRNAVE